MKYIARRERIVLDHLGMFEADTPEEAADKAEAVANALLKQSEEHVRRQSIVVMELPGEPAGWDSFHHEEFLGKVKP
jgi:hypothetical protein